MYDLAQHIPVAVLARSKGKKPSKKASGSGPSNLPSKKISASTSSPGVQATYNLTPNEGGGGDDEDPNKKHQGLERSHTVQTPVRKAPSKVTQEETSQDKDKVQQEETPEESKDTETVGEEHKSQAGKADQEETPEDSMDKEDDKVEEEHKTQEGKPDQEESPGDSKDKELVEEEGMATELVEEEDKVEGEVKV